MNPIFKEILEKYQNDLDWLLYDLSSIYINKETFTYNNPLGKITIEIN